MSETMKNVPSDSDDKSVNTTSVPSIHAACPKKNRCRRAVVINGSSAHQIFVCANP